MRTGGGSRRASWTCLSAPSSSSAPTSAPCRSASSCGHGLLASPALVGSGAAFLLYVLLDETLAYYEEVSDRLHGDIARLDERALRDNGDAFLTDLLAFKRYAFALARLAEQHPRYSPPSDAPTSPEWPMPGRRSGRRSRTWRRTWHASAMP